MAGMLRRVGLGVLAAATAALGGRVAAQTGTAQTWPPPGVSYYGDPAVPDIAGLWLGVAILVAMVINVYVNRVRTGTTARE